MQNILHIGKEYTSSELISSILCGYQSVQKHELSDHIKGFIDELLDDNETNSDRINLIIWMANVFHPIHTIKSGDSGEIINGSIANCFDYSNEFWKDLKQFPKSIDQIQYYQDMLKLFVRISQISFFENEDLLPYLGFFEEIRNNRFDYTFGAGSLSDLHEEIGYNDNSKKRIYNTMKRFIETFSSPNSRGFFNTLALMLLDVAKFPPNEPPNFFLKYAKSDNRFLIKYWQCSI